MGSRSPAINRDSGARGSRAYGDGVVRGEDDVKLTGGNQVLVVEDDLREMGKKAAWSVSSCKPGNGVSALRDDNLETYWQLTLQSISVVLHLFCLVLMLITSLVADLMAFNLIW